MALENWGRNKQSREEYSEESNDRGKCCRELQHLGITGIWSEKNTNCRK